jgi:hypothetical protein
VATRILVVARAGEDRPVDVPEAAMNTLTARTRRAMSAYLVAMASAVAVVAAIGVFGRGDGSTVTFVTSRGETVELVTTGVYVHNAERVVAEGIGWDLVTLLLIAPALFVVARSVARGSARARLVAVGLLAYTFYQYFMYAMAWAVGPLLVPFVAIYAGSLIGIAWFVASIPLDELERRVTDRFPYRAMAVFSVAMALVLLGMWLPMIAAVLGGQLQDTLNGQTTLVVQALDLGLVVPVAIATAVLAWRRRPLGTLLAATLVIKGLAMAVAIVAMVLSAWYVEGELEVAGLVIFVVAGGACAALARAMYRAIQEDPRPAESSPTTGSGPAAAGDGETRDLRHAGA